MINENLLYKNKYYDELFEPNEYALVFNIREEFDL